MSDVRLYRGWLVIPDFGKIPMLCKAAGALLLKKRYPLIAVWHLTYKCNLRCKYCGFWERRVEELDTPQALGLVDELHALGIKFISISGGEPLLRSDLGDIVSACKKKGMFVSINSNGTLIRDRIAHLRHADVVKLSLDGPQDINDGVRGYGVYNKVMQAVDVCRENGIDIDMTTVISKHNISAISHILDLAKRYNFRVCFQPASQTHCGSLAKTLFAEVPDKSEYVKVISYLVKEKRKGNPHISNSVSGLKHLSFWPEPKKISCLVSRLSLFISPDRRTFLCDMFPGSEHYLAAPGKSLRKNFDSLSLPSPCSDCWVGSVVDFNLLADFKSDCILGAVQKFMS